MTTDNRAPLQPNWEHWRVMPLATIFECVALSLDIEPNLADSYRREVFMSDERAGIRRPRLNPRPQDNPWASKSEPANPVVAEFEERLRHLNSHAMFLARYRIAAANVSGDGPLRPDVIAAGTTTAHVRLRLEDFVAWAQSINWWLPPQLAALWEDDKRGNDKSTTLPNWITLARTKATEICLRDKKQGLRPFKREIATEIAQAFRKEGVIGRRTELSESYVLRHALKDWKPPK